MAGPNATIIGRVAVKVAPDTSDFRRDAKRELDAIERGLGDIEIDFTANVHTAVDEVRDAIKQAQRAAQDVNFDVEVGQLSKRKAQAELALLGRTRVVHLLPTVDKTAATKAAASIAALAGGRAIADMASNFGRWIGELDRSVPRLATAALSVTNLGSVALVSSANILSLGQSLASTAGAALALPGIFAGIGIGAASTYAALQDIGDYLPGLGGRFAALQDSMSQRFWTIAADPIRALVDTLFPQFEAGLKRTGSALGTFFAGFAASSVGAFDNQIAAMFDDLNRSIRISSQYTDDFAGILAKLGSVGAGNLPRLARWFGDISRSFDNWLELKGRNGLQEYVDAGVSALKDLGGVLLATGSLFGGLAKAAEAGGGSTLASLRDTMERAADAVNSTKFQRSLTGVFAASQRGMDNLTDSGGEFQRFMLRLSSVLTRVLPKAGDTAGDALTAIFDALDRPRIANAAVDAFDKLDEAVGNLTPALPKVSDALAAIIDVVGDLTVNVSRALGPALEGIAPVVEDLADDLDPLVDQLGKLLVNAVELAVPVLDDLGGTLGGVAGAISDVLTPVNVLIDFMQKLPSPIGSVLSNVAAATTAFLLMNRAIAGFKASEMVQNLSALVTNLRTAETRAKALGTAMRGAAGIGGMLAFTASASQTDRAVGDLLQTLGLAATGFALGGPIGFAIGGTTGALLGLMNATKESTEAAVTSKRTWQDYASTLDQATAATTRATRQMAIQSLMESGLIKNAAELGLSRQTLISASLGEEKARDKLTAAMEAQRNVADDLIDQASKGLSGGVSPAEQAELAAEAERRRGIVDAIEAEIGATSKSIRMKTTEIALMNKIPRRIVSKYLSPGLIESLADVRELTRRMNLTPKQVRTVIELAGLKASKGEIGKFVRTLRTTKGDMPQLEAGVRGSLSRANREAKSGVDRLVSELKSGTRGAKPDFGPFAGAIPGALAPAAEAANSGGANVGAQLKAGMQGGFAGVISSMAATAAAAIRAALAAARAEAKIKSPSRKMMEIGDYMGQGLVLGLERQIPDVARAGKKAAKAVFDKGFARELEKAVDRSRDLFDKLVDKVGRKGAAAVRKRFGDDIKRLGEMARTHEKLMRQYEKAVEKLQSVRSDMRAFEQQVRETIIDAANPTDIGDNYDGIVSSLQDAATQARDFRTVIRDLIKQGLNRTTLKQILAAGPQAGLATAQAILSGGVKQINKLQRQINEAAKGVGKASGQELFGGLLNEAQSDVDRLLDKLVPLQRRLRQFARELVDALRDELEKQFKRAKSESTAKVSKVATSAPKTNAGALANATASAKSGAGVTNVVNLTYVANGPTLSAEEQLFAAAKRGRFAFSA